MPDWKFKLRKAFFVVFALVLATEITIALCMHENQSWVSRICIGILALAGYKLCRREFRRRPPEDEE